MRPYLRTESDGVTPQLVDWDMAGGKVKCKVYDFAAVPRGWGVAVHEARYGNPEPKRQCRLVHANGQTEPQWFWWGQRAWCQSDRTEFHSLVVPDGIDVIVEAVPPEHR